MSLLQYVAQFVALLDVYDDTFLSTHHIVIHIIYKNIPNLLLISDTIRCIVVCQTDAYPSGKLVFRAAETDSR